MLWLNKIKGSFYTLFFIILNVIYLIIELSFNARILDISAAFTPSTDFAQLEIYGRTISASGATLFAWRLLVPSWSSFSLFKLLLKFLLIALVVFPVIFIGQKNLVDNLVNQSSNETRRTAEILNLLKFGIANGFVEIEELAVDDLILQTAEGKMFITLSGLLAYNSSNMRDILERELDKIAGYAVATQQAGHSDKLYKSYLYVSKQIMTHYAEYQSLVDTLEHRQSGSYGKAIDLYQNAMNQALLQWVDYQQATKQSVDLNKVTSAQVASIQYLLMTAQQRINTCTNGECFKDGVQQLQMKLAQRLGFYSTVSDWCQSFKKDGLKLQCLKESTEIHYKIVNLRQLTLAVNAGLTAVYASKLEFLTSMDFRSSVFSLLKQQGVVIDAGWTFDRYEIMLNDISQQMNNRYLNEYGQSTFKQFGSDLKARSELSTFSQIDKMQNYFAQAFGELYRQPVKLNLTQQEFERIHIAPVYLAKLNTLVNKLKADEKWYEADAPYEQSGKSSLRNLLIPAIAIAFSLIFGLLNFINLILNLLFLIIEEKFWLRWLSFSVLGVFILMMPVRHDYKIYNQPAYLDLLSETQSNYGYWGNVLDWVAKTEPLVYPIGNIFRYNLLDGFSFD